LTITSPHNPHLKEIRRLHRRRSRDQAGRFVAEGEDLLAAADAAGWPTLERYCAAGSGLAGTEVAPAALRAVSALGSGTRALGVYEQRFAVPAGPVCLALWGIADPGNVGTGLGSAAAF
jgi:RNA methyltransferase, TrmH family